MTTKSKKREPAVDASPDRVTLVPAKKPLERLTEVIQTLGQLPKTGRNPAQNYSFAQHHELVARVSPALSERGLLLAMDVTDSNYESYQSARGQKWWHCTIEARFTLFDVYADPPDNIALSFNMHGEASDMSDKAFNKASTACHKQALLKLLMVAVEDPDAPDTEKSSPGYEEVPARAPSRQVVRAPQSKDQVSPNSILLEPTGTVNEQTREIRFAPGTLTVQESYERANSSGPVQHYVFGESLQFRDGRGNVVSPTGTWTASFEAFTDNFALHKEFSDGTRERGEFALVAKLSNQGDRWWSNIQALRALTNDNEEDNVENNVEDLPW